MARGVLDRASRRAAPWGLALTLTFGQGACAPSAGSSASANSPAAASPPAADAPQGAPAVAPDGAGTQGSKGALPPDFELDTLDGGSFRLSERLGKDVILIDFWATYCDPCLAAMPHLNALYLQNKARGFLVLGVSIDGPGSSAEIHSTVAKLGVEFPILLDTDSRVVSQYNPRVSAPYSVLIGRDGRVIARQEGYTSGKGEVLRQNVEQALGAGQ